MPTKTALAFLECGLCAERLDPNRFNTGSGAKYSHIWD
jgi:hypothetical protein